jgi:hypothetical protein
MREGCTATRIARVWGTAAARVEALRPTAGFRATYAPGTVLQAFGTVLAVVESDQTGYAFLVEWDAGGRRGGHGPEGFDPAAQLAGLVMVVEPDPFKP